MTASERIKAHYDARTGDGRASLVVPELSDEGEVFTVWWKPFTLADHARIFGAEPRDAKAYAQVVFRKAEDRDGRRLFPEPGDLHVLAYEADQSVIRRIAEAIMAAPSVSDFAEALRRDQLRMAIHSLADRLGRTVEEIEGMSVAAFRETLAFHRVRKEEDKG